MQGSWTYSRYKTWVREQSASFQCIIFVILIFPLAAVTWDKPLVAGLTIGKLLGSFVFLFSAIIGLRKIAFQSNYSILFLFLGFMVLINHLLLQLSSPDISKLSIATKALLPFGLVLFFTVHRITRRIIEGLFITFLISSLFPLATLYYEVIVGPIRVVENTISRGGGARLCGFYSDMFMYMNHLVGCFLIYGYFFISARKSRHLRFYYRNSVLIVVIALYAIGIYNLRHQASWAVFLFTLSLLAFFYMKRSSFLGFALIGSVVAAIFILFFSNVFEVLFAKDINVFNGDARAEAALNGRAWIWSRYYLTWSDFDLFSRLFGCGFSNNELGYVMASGGMHSDYVRLFFTVGIVGFLVYLSFLLSMFVKALNFNALELRYFFLSTLMVVVLLSVSSLPLFASGTFIYLVTLVIGLLGKCR